jgi:putative drug exporter of the RND superfamily
MFHALGKFCYRFRWIVIAVWVVLFGVSVVATPLLANVLTAGFSNPNAPSQQAAALIQKTFNQGETNLLVIFKSETLKATSDEFTAVEQKALDMLSAANLANLQSIQTYMSTGSDLLVSKDGSSSVAVLNFSAPAQTVQKEYKDIETALSGGPLQTYITGSPAVNAELTDLSFKDLRKVEIYGLPVALIALIFVFGSLVSAALPVVTGGLAVTVALGGLYLLGRATSMSIFVMNTATLLGLAVAIDYALFMVSRFREELHKGATVQEAVGVTVARAGRSVFFSGLAVVVGVVGLVFFPSPGLRSVGIGGALVVFFSVAASVTFLPALLGVLGHRVDRLPVIRLHEAREGKLWRRWANLLVKRPWGAIIAAVVLIALLAGPAATMKTQMSGATTLPSSAQSRQGLEILDSEYDRTALSPVSVMLTWDGDGKIDMLRAAAIFSYGQQLAKTPGVASVLSPFTVGGFGGDVTAMASFWSQFQQLLNDPDNFSIPANGITVNGQTITAAQLEQFKQLVKSSVAPGAILFEVTATGAPNSTQAQDLIESLTSAPAPAGYHVYVAGESASTYDFFNELNTWFPWVIAWVVVTSLIVFAVLLRSVILPVLTVGVNLLTIAMSYGLMVLLFQGTTFEKILRFTSTGGIDAVVPVVILCILFGITMDYAVFMLTRTHERWNRTRDNRDSLITGVTRTGRIIASAALLVVIVTGAFAFTNITQTKMLGMGISLAIIADAVLIRFTLLPAIMAYLGRANWWWPQFEWVKKLFGGRGRAQTGRGDEDENRETPDVPGAPGRRDPGRLGPGSAGGRTAGGNGGRAAKPQGNPGVVRPTGRVNPELPR